MSGRSQAPAGSNRFRTTAARGLRGRGHDPELFFRHVTTQQIMIASYTTSGNVAGHDKPRVWSPGRAPFRPRLRPHAHCTLTASAWPSRRGDPQTTRESDKVVFVFNFFDELRRLAPAK